MSLSLVHPVNQGPTTSPHQITTSKMSSLRRLHQFSSSSSSSFRSSLLLLPLILFLLHLILPVLPASSSSAPQNDHHFEQFVSRQLFPSSIDHPTEGDGPSFRANCSVPICEGSLAPIFCSGPLISSAWYFGIQQQCPGSRLLHAPSQIVTNFKSIVRDNVVKKGDFLQFCEENFENAAYLQPANLTDWHPNPPNFEKITNTKMKKFSASLHQIWPSLTREFIVQVQRDQGRYPVLAVPNRFVVPGGFFKVYFYWDTYWILKGLHFSNLFKTAHGMLENFAHVLRVHGFIPNSGNVQLSRRSQPPLFTQMIVDHFEATKNKTFLVEFLPHAEKELDWWRQNRSIEIERGEGERHQMFQYKAVTDCPRPENFLEDYQLGIQTADPQYFWSSTASACESGLDFSSRWYKWGGGGGRVKGSENDDGGNGKKEVPLSRQLIATNDVLPVDLNTFMALNYWTVARLYGKVLGNQRKADEYRELAQKLTASIDRIFHDPEKGAWFDFDLEQRKLRTKFYPSNIYPLLLEGNRPKYCQKVVEYLRGSGALGFKGGIPSSLERNSNEQWDFPNVWAPQQHLFVASLLECDGEAAKIGRQVADGFLKTAYNGFFNAVGGKPAQMWEKYDARYDNGRPGFGGEYPAQSGFGWTNGVVFEFIRLFYASGGESSDSRANVADQAQLLAFDSMGGGLFNALNQFTFHR